MQRSIRQRMRRWVTGISFVTCCINSDSIMALSIATMSWNVLDVNVKYRSMLGCTTTKRNERHDRWSPNGRGRQLNQQSLHDPEIWSQLLFLSRPSYLEPRGKTPTECLLVKGRYHSSTPAVLFELWKSCHTFDCIKPHLASRCTNSQEDVQKSICAAPTHLMLATHWHGYICRLQQVMTFRNLAGKGDRSRRAEFFLQWQVSACSENRAKSKKLNKAGWFK